jgi:AdoMet-dependent rRNA methyltransferase SPB1
MQLQMTTPLDIGLEQQDATLALGQDDVFDITRAENALRNGQINDDDDAMDESDDEEMEEDASEINAVLDSDQERERKVMGLEAELDGLYDAYQDRLRERDAKYKVMEARRKNAEREEWHGIQEKQDDDDSSVGGWDEKAGSDLSDDSESDDEPEVSVAGGKKRPHIEDHTSHSSKRPRLVTKLEEPKLPVSKAAQVWFSQDVFTGIDNGEDGFEDDSDDENMSIDERSRQSPSEAAVRTIGCIYFPILIVSQPTSGDEDDFDVVSQEQENDDDDSVWVIENDNDNIRRALFCSVVRLPVHVTLHHRTWPRYPRGHDTCPAAC